MSQLKKCGNIDNAYRPEHLYYPVHRDTGHSYWHYPAHYDEKERKQCFIVHFFYMCWNSAGIYQHEGIRLPDESPPHGAYRSAVSLGLGTSAFYLFQVSYP